MIDLYYAEKIEQNIEKKGVEIFVEIAYHNINRTPRTSHVSDVSHGETFYFRRNNCGYKQCCSGCLIEKYDKN